MQQIDITPKWYEPTTDAIVRAARVAVLCDVTVRWFGEKSRFGDGHKEHIAAGMRVSIGEDRVVAIIPNDTPTFPAFCAAMLDRLSAGKVRQLVAGRVRLMRGEGTRRDCVMMGGAGPSSNLPAVEITDPETGQFLVDVHAPDGRVGRLWSSHAGI
jgi:hypothetical protein